MNRKVLSRFRDDMQLHGLSVHTQEAYERHVRRFLDVSSSTVFDGELFMLFEGRFLIPDS